MSDSLKIAVIGAGYVGLVSGTCFAAKGHKVNMLDLRRDVVESINAGVATIHENGLPELLAKVTKSKSLRSCVATSEAIGEAEVVLICVGTPSKNGAIDLSQVRAACKMVGKWLRGISHFATVVVKSTVLPGTTDTFVAKILEESSGKKLAAGEFGLGMNPEFLREGEAVGDFNAPDRIVFGHEDTKTLSLLETIYSGWSCDKLRVNTRTAEMIKYANNCLLALQISAANELANIASAVGGIDFMDVLAGVCADKRWNPITSQGLRANPAILSYLVPGCGFGGSCFPKDVEAMRSLSRIVGTEPQILQAVLDVNSHQPIAVLEPLIRELGGNLLGKKILLLGLAFKPGTDDVRESASLKIARRLMESGATVLAHDPIACSNAMRALGDKNFQVVDNWGDFIKICDAVIVATRWPEYTSLKNHSPTLQGKPVLDCRRLLNAADFSQSTFFTVGKTTKQSTMLDFQ
jgi:UDPglucose 6-dehydrogenase/GDP-mannose 6-dehydrogenase